MVQHLITRVQCQCIAESTNSRCTRKADSGKKYCWQHLHCKHQYLQKPSQQIQNWQSKFIEEEQRRFENSYEYTEYHSFLNFLRENWFDDRMSYKTFRDIKDDAIKQFEIKHNNEYELFVDLQPDEVNYLYLQVGKSRNLL